MTRQRGKDASSHRRGGGTQPAPDDSDIRRSKQEREPRSKEEMQRDRDPDAIQRNTRKPARSK
jgi:hypothetical protein